jgi:hypothetical protein
MICFLFRQMAFIALRVVVGKDGLMINVECFCICCYNKDQLNLDRKGEILMKQPERTYEELRDEIEMLIDDYISANNRMNVTVCAERIMQECGIHDINASHTHHELKTDPEVFQASLDGLKNFEIRLNDRDFRQGDTLTLRETEHSGEEMSNGAPLKYTGRSLDCKINYVLHGGRYGLADGWVILAVYHLS